MIAPRATYTAEWAIVPTATPDYWAFLNAVRRLIDAGVDLVWCELSNADRAPAVAFAEASPYEGVETLEQRSLLEAQGCDQIQGFLVSEPLTADELANRLRRRDG